MKPLHDATFLSATFAWGTAKATLSFALFGERKDEGYLVAEGVADFHIPRKLEWGRSVSVNVLRGPSHLENGLQKIEIEMQSGDVVTVVAASFQIPE